MVGENGWPVTPDWSPEPREAPEFIRDEVKLPLLWEGDQA